MMTRKQLIIVLLCIVAIVAAAVGYGIYHMQTREGENKIDSTNNDGYAIEEIPHADSLMVGKWQSTKNPKWYKVYFDDYDEDGFYWGKEWDETDDVLEEDLNYHGNGWFRWKNKGTELIELATMDRMDVPIAKTYSVRIHSHDTLVYYDAAYKKYVFSFKRVK